jgi:hypothetical protein
VAVQVVGSAPAEDMLHSYPHPLSHGDRSVHVHLALSEVDAVPIG